MTHKLLFFIAMILCPLFASAQKLKAVSISYMPGASVAQQRNVLDKKGRLCACVTVSCPAPEFKISGRIERQDPPAHGRIRAFVPHGTRWIEVQAPGYAPLKVRFKDINHNILGVESEADYNLVIEISDEKDPEYKPTGLSLGGSYTIGSLPGASLYIYNPEAKSVGEEGGTFTLLVNCNTDWSVRTDAGWCRAVKSGKGSEGQEEVTVTVEAAPEGESRTCIVIFTCAGVETTVSVAQGTAGYYFAASPASIDVGRNGGEYTISVASNVLWTVVASHSWLHIDTMQGKGNGDIHVTAEPNPATSPRTATLTFTSTQQTGAYTQVCTFVQEPGRAADEWDNDTPEK